MSAHQFLSPFFILKLVSFILLSSLLNARVANALPNPHINPQKRLVSITALLQSAGLDVKTYAYGDDVAPQVKTELKKISVTTPTDTKINIGKELPSIGAYLSDRPYEKKTVDIIVTKKDDDQVLAFYNFDLGKNMNPEDQAANGADDKTAILGLKWVHDSFRGTKSALGTSPGKYTLNMAITEMGWQIMELQHTNCWTLLASHAGIKSAQNAGMEVEITDAKRGTGLGTLVFAGRKTWESKVEDLNKKLGS